MIVIKYYINKPLNRFAQRTLSTFSEKMILLLMEKSFEEITVNELCKLSNYPRATFYNYFDDKYDLLNYCWGLLCKEIHLDDYKENVTSEKALFEILNRMYDFLYNNINKLKSIIHINTIDGELISSFIIYLKNQVKDIMKKSPCTKKYDIPWEIISEHYSNTIILVLEWSFLRNNRLSKEETNKYIKYLLNGI